MSKENGMDASLWHVLGSDDLRQFTEGFALVNRGKDMGTIPITFRYPDVSDAMDLIQKSETVQKVMFEGMSSGESGGEVEKAFVTFLYQAAQMCTIPPDDFDWSDEVFADLMRMTGGVDGSLALRLLSVLFGSVGVTTGRDPDNVPLTQEEMMEGLKDGVFNRGDAGDESE